MFLWETYSKSSLRLLINLSNLSVFWLRDLCKLMELHNLLWIWSSKFIHSCSSHIIGPNQEFFRARKVSCNKTIQKKNFVYKTRKKGPAGKQFGIFSLRFSQNNISNEKLNPQINAIRVLFSIFKKGQRRPPPSLLVVLPLNTISSNYLIQ